ncbi:TRDC protein, partial [Nothoprocta ornata]|nr:TRDC protein [Nothoprocta ornata]
IKSKKVKEESKNVNAVCLARNFYPKDLSLEASPNEVLYEQNKPTLTSEGTYSTIKVVQVKPETQVTCVAKFNGSTYTKHTLPEKEIEEPVTVNVCSVTDTSTKGVKAGRVNMLSMAVLGLRVLLAKSIAFNTLLSIKLFLF